MTLFKIKESNKTVHKDSNERVRINQLGEMIVTLQTVRSFPTFGTTTTTREIGYRNKEINSCRESWVIRDGSSYRNKRRSRPGSGRKEISETGVVSDVRRHVLLVSYYLSILIVPKTLQIRTTFVNRDKNTHP